MANIAIINKCNLKCPYCFADEMIHENTKLITIEEYRKVLAFLKGSSNNRIGIIGGEPTIHPQIGEILKETGRYCQENGVGAVLFTNGIELSGVLAEISKDLFNVLVNVNHPDIVGKENYEKMEATLAYCYQKLDWYRKVGIGVNVYHELSDYDFIFDLVRKYGIPSVRVSFVAPTYKDHALDKDLYYKKAIGKFIDVCVGIKEAGGVVQLDCNRVPFCYLTSEEKELLFSTLEPGQKIDNRCEPVVDITADFKATACFGTYDPIDLNDFDNYDDAYYYLMVKKMYPLAIANNQGKCSTCKNHETLSCQGGCLAFAKDRL